MARKWLRNGALAAVLAIGSLGSTGIVSGGFVPSALARDYSQSGSPTGQIEGAIAVRQLPKEAANTLNLIAAGGPYPYPKDGVVFGNYERQLPARPRGYYHEYTVPTPRAKNRGARRIVCGGALRQVDNCFYTDDHYNSFKRIVE
ncbi:ribonuclease [Trinickia terrae]|uniref:Ribonuclease n=1 Tax=Trinickia terrae TaxID=2571161 RepID=A0A4U1IBN9_9BURK|nr:ribonuclease [Trinickia terrae]TKC90982.1 ribonuclease [Trinickia terrae]